MIGRCLKVSSLMPTLGADVILDPVGAKYWEQHVRCLAVDSRLLSIGLVSVSAVVKLWTTPWLQRCCLIVLHVDYTVVSVQIIHELSLSFPPALPPSPSSSVDQ